jgi:hypothetical protein
MSNRSRGGSAAPDSNVESAEATRLGAIVGDDEAENSEDTASRSTRSRSLPAGTDMTMEGFPRHLVTNYPNR